MDLLYAAILVSIYNILKQIINILQRTSLTITKEEKFYHNVFGIGFECIQSFVK
jgi:hypothetical protein